MRGARKQVPPGAMVHSVSQASSIKQLRRACGRFQQTYTHLNGTQPAPYFFLIGSVRQFSIKPLGRRLCHCPPRAGIPKRHVCLFLHACVGNPDGLLLTQPTMAMMPPAESITRAIEQQQPMVTSEMMVMQPNKLLCVASTPPGDQSLRAPTSPPHSAPNKRRRSGCSVSNIASDRMQTRSGSRHPPIKQPRLSEQLNSNTILPFVAHPIPSTPQPAVVRRPEVPHSSTQHDRCGCSISNTHCSHQAPAATENDGHLPTFSASRCLNTPACSVRQDNCHNQGVLRSDKDSPQGPQQQEGHEGCPSSCQQTPSGSDLSTHAIIGVREHLGNLSLRLIIVGHNPGAVYPMYGLFCEVTMR